MVPVTQKREIGTLDGTPEKRLFWSIISDYDTTTAICELVDNAVDLWWQQSSKTVLTVDISLDVERQVITIQDDAGGVSHKDLRLLVAPGGSNNDPNASTIGIFGVGSKRAVVALAENIVIRTRRSADTYQIDIDEHWLRSPKWDMPLHEIPSIPQGTTQVSLTALRRTIPEDLDN